MQRKQHCSKAWLKDFKLAEKCSSKKWLKDCRIHIWRQTQAVARSRDYHGASSFVTSYKVQSDFNPPLEGCAQQVLVMPIDILSMALKLRRQGVTVAVLNMACDRVPGGGVDGGCGAQEENLYRRTDMCLATRNHHCDHYPLQGQALITSPVVLMRGEEEDGYPFLDTGEHVTVISCAAPKSPTLSKRGGYANWWERLEMRRRIQNVLHAACLTNCHTILLSAFGCGAYKNPPYEVASLFHEELQRRQLQRVIFCIKEDHNSHKISKVGNFRPFQAWFPSLCCEYTWKGWHCQICGQRR